MKKILTLALICFSAMLNAQNLDVKSGLGCGQVKIGMSESEVRKIMKIEFDEKNYEEEMQSFKSTSINFHIDSIIQFILGFDKCVSPESPNLDNSPIFNLYFKNDKLVFIGITSYSVDEKIMKSVLLDKKIRFNTDQDECISILGNKYLPVSYGDYTGDHLYYEKGLEMTYDENKLTFIGIFAPQPRLLQLIGEKRKMLQQQYDALPKVKEDDDDN
jgi:hypothetical protein